MVKWIMIFVMIVGVEKEIQIKNICHFDLFDCQMLKWGMSNQYDYCNCECIVVYVFKSK